MRRSLSDSIEVKGRARMVAKTGKTGVPTISDVAELAGVSRAVASRALSSEPRPVSADKRERVVQAAQRLGFTPNLLAQSLTKKTVNLIAVVVNHIHDLSDLDLFDRLLEAVQAIGKQVIMIRVGSTARVDDLLRTSVAYHVDAALVFSDFADAATVRKMFRTEQVVMLNGKHDALSPAVIPDEGAGIGQAVADAVRKGVRTVALITGRETSDVEKARSASYRAAFAANGLELLREVAGDYSYASGREAASAIIGLEAPDAVFCSSDAMAMGVLDLCREDFSHGRPKRFRLYGFDNVSLTDFDAYPIASIGYDKTVYVQEIVKLLRHPESFRAGDPPVLVPTRFVPRLTA